MNQKKLTVCKANQLIEATYRLTLNEHRVMSACIAQIDSTAPLSVTDKFELSAKDFAKLFGISEDRAYSELQEIAKTLYQRSLTIYNPDPAQPKLKKLETRWISTIGYIPEDGKIFLQFSQYILPYLSELKGQFTKYELDQISGMTSIYAFRLYELLMQWKTTGTRTIEIDWLKKQFELDESYDRMFDLKKRVIDPAVKDINTHSNYQVSWTQRKTGRKVTHLIFEFAEKTEKKTAKTKAKNKETTDVFQGLTAKQIDLFSAKLANDSAFGSQYAKIGEQTNAFTLRIKQELQDIKKQQLYLPYLKKLGFQLHSH